MGIKLNSPEGNECIICAYTYALDFIPKEFKVQDYVNLRMQVLVRGHHSIMSVII